MKILISLLLVLSVSKVEFYGSSYIVYDCLNDCIVEGYKIDRCQSVASISKIMTAILVIENSKLDRIVKIDETINKAYGSCVYLHIGDSITVKDLLYGLMLRSGNDCALMLAKVVGGSVDKFVGLMNDKAKELKMYNSLFSNPSGLDEEDNGNVSCVKDMAILYDYCCQNPFFNKIVKTKEYCRDDGLGYWHNKNRLLKEYKYCIGGKTGFTKKAKRTLITRARKDNNDLIIVTFNCGNDFEFHKNKYEECFKKYNELVLFDKGVRYIEGNWYLFNDDLMLKARKGDKVSYKVNNGYLALYSNDNYVGRIKLSEYSFFKLFVMILSDFYE